MNATARDGGHRLRHVLIGAVALVAVAALLWAAHGAAAALAAPNPPKNLSVQPCLDDNRTCLDLDWDPPDADHDRTLAGYRIYRGTAEDDRRYHASVDPNETTYRDTSGTDPGTTYFYTVRASYGNQTRAAGQTLESNGTQANATTYRLPNPPRNVQARPDVGQITVTWDVPNATRLPVTGYGIQATDLDGTSVRNWTLGANTTRVVEDNVTANHTRRYTLRATNAIGPGANATVEATTFARPSAPRNVTARPGPGAGEVTLTWQAPADDGRAAVEGYRIHRAAPRGPLSPIGDVTASAGSFNDTGRQPNTTYVYAVTARNAVGWSPNATANATTFAPPAAPRHTAVETGPGAGNLTVHWNAPADDGGMDLLSYRVFRQATPGGPWKEVGQTNASTTLFTDTGLAAGIRRTYRVAAASPVGLGPFGPSDRAFTHDVPSPPQGLTVQAGPGPGQIDLAWQAPADDGGLPVAGYRILAGPDLSTVAEVGPGTTSYQDDGLDPGTDRTYRILALSKAGPGTPTTPRTATTYDVPAPPDNVTVTRRSDDVVLGWDPGPGDAELALVGYVVQRRPTGGQWTPVAEVGPGNLSLVDTPPGDVTFTYRVAAVNDAGRSAYTSAQVAVHHPAPAGPTATDTGEQAGSRSASSAGGLAVPGNLGWSLLGGLIVFAALAGAVLAWDRLSRGEDPGIGQAVSATATGPVPDPDRTDPATDEPGAAFRTVADDPVDPPGEIVLLAHGAPRDGEPARVRTILDVAGEVGIDLETARGFADDPEGAVDRRTAVAGTLETIAEAASHIDVPPGPTGDAAAGEDPDRSLASIRDDATDLLDDLPTWPDVEAWDPVETMVRRLRRTAAKVQDRARDRRLLEEAHDRIDEVRALLDEAGPLGPATADGLADAHERRQASQTPRDVAAWCRRVKARHGDLATSARDAADQLPAGDPAPWAAWWTGRVAAALARDDPTSRVGRLLSARLTGRLEAPDAISRARSALGEPLPAPIRSYLDGAARALDAEPDGLVEGPVHAVADLLSALADLPEAVREAALTEVAVAFSRLGHPGLVAPALTACIRRLADGTAIEEGLQDLADLGSALPARERFAVGVELARTLGVSVTAKGRADLADRAARVVLRRPGRDPDATLRDHLAGQTVPGDLDDLDRDLLDAAARALSRSFVVDDALPGFDEALAAAVRSEVDRCTVTRRDRIAGTLCRGDRRDRIDEVLAALDRRGRVVYDPDTGLVARPLDHDDPVEVHRLRRDLLRHTDPETASDLLDRILGERS